MKLHQPQHQRLNSASMRGAVECVLLLLVLVLVQCCAGAVEAGSFLANSPRHAPRIGRRGGAMQSSGGGAAKISRGLYYQMPKSYLRVGRADPAVALHAAQLLDTEATEEDLLRLLARMVNLKHDTDQRQSVNEITDETNEITNAGGSESEEAYSRDLRAGHHGRYFRGLRASENPSAQQFERVDDLLSRDDYYNSKGRTPNEQLYETSKNLGYTDDDQSFESCVDPHCAPSAKGALQHLLGIILREVTARRQDSMDINSRLSRNDAAPEPLQLWKR